MTEHSTYQTAAVARDGLVSVSVAAQRSSRDGKLYSQRYSSTQGQQCASSPVLRSPSPTSLCAMLTCSPARRLFSQTHIAIHRSCSALTTGSRPPPPRPCAHCCPAVVQAGRQAAQHCQCATSPCARQHSGCGGGRLWTGRHPLGFCHGQERHQRGPSR